MKGNRMMIDGGEGQAIKPGRLARGLFFAVGMVVSFSVLAVLIFVLPQYMELAEGVGESLSWFTLVLMNALNILMLRPWVAAPFLLAFWGYLVMVLIGRWRLPRRWVMWLLAVVAVAIVGVVIIGMWPLMGQQR